VPFPADAADIAHWCFDNTHMQEVKDVLAEFAPLGLERQFVTSYFAAFSRWKCVLRPAPDPG
jgi:hypothetical protein